MVPGKFSNKSYKRSEVILKQDIRYCPGGFWTHHGKIPVDFETGHGEMLRWFSNESWKMSRYFSNTPFDDAEAICGPWKLSNSPSRQVIRKLFIPFDLHGRSGTSFVDMNSRIQIFVAWKTFEGTVFRSMEIQWWTFVQKKARHGNLWSSFEHPHQRSSVRFLVPVEEVQEVVHNTQIDAHQLAF